MSATPTAPAAAPAPSAPATSAPTSAPSAVSASNAPAAPKEPSSHLPPGDRPKQDEAQAQQPSGAAEAVAAAKAEEARKLKLKVNGREREMDEAEVIRRAQMFEAADEKFKEAAAMRKQFDGFLEALRADPVSVLTHPDLGIDFRGLAEQHLTAELKRELMSPEQRELEELREFRRQSEERNQQTEQERAAQAKQAEMQQLQTRAAQEYDKQITAALTESHLPKTPGTIKRVVELMQNALANGYDLDVPTAVDLVREGYQTDLQALVGSLDGEALLKVLGDGIVGKLRKHDLATLRRKLDGQQAAPAAAPAAPRAPATRSTEPKKLSTQEWLAAVRAKAGV